MGNPIDLQIAHSVWLILAFIAGATVGSFINVVAGRLPLEKSVLWPNSRCLSCLNPLGLLDNVPIIGWLRLRGRCRFCGSPFSIRYMLIELLLGLVYAGLFYLDVLADWHRMPFFSSPAVRADLNSGVVPWQGGIVFLHHALLVSFLLAAAICDLDHRSIPLSLTTTGTVVGLIMAVCFPWPFPNGRDVIPQVQPGQGWAFNIASPPQGMYPWPAWGPMPDWIANNPWIYGLLTGLAGAAAGMVLIRSAKFLFETGLGKEALGLGDADLMMMAGAFLGWQIVVVAFFVGAIVSLPFGVILMIVKKDRSLPFGPGLALGCVITWLLWPWIGPQAQPMLFDHVLILLSVTVFGGGMFVLSLLLRFLGLGGQPAAPAAAK